MLRRDCQGDQNLVDAGFRPQVIMSLLRRNKGQMEALCTVGGIARRGLGQVQHGSAHSARRAVA